MLSGLFYFQVRRIKIGGTYHNRRIMIGDPTHNRLATLGGTPLATLGRDPPSGRVIKRCRQHYGCRRLYPATRDTSHPRSVPRRDSRSLQGRRLGILQVPNRRPYPVDYRPAPHLVVVLRRNCARTAVREAVPASRNFIQLHAAPRLPSVVCSAVRLYSYLVICPLRTLQQRRRNVLKGHSHAR